MAARTLPTERERRVTVMLVPYMSCGAKLPIYTLFASCFFHGTGGAMIGAVYVLGVFAAAVAAAVLRRAYPPDSEAEYILEMPPWRLPTAKNILRALYFRAGEFLSRAFGIRFLSSVAVWALSTFDLSFYVTYDGDRSILAFIGRLIAPVFEPLGFGDWRAAAALISGLSAKEAVIGTLSVLAGAGGIGSIFTKASSLSFLAFTLLYTPCASAIAAMRGELGSKKAMFASLCAGLVLAWCVAFAVYHAACALGI